jgi:hypothetical protein
MFALADDPIVDVGSVGAIAAAPLMSRPASWPALADTGKGS